MHRVHHSRHSFPTRRSSDLRSMTLADVISTGRSLTLETVHSSRSADEERMNPLASVAAAAVPACSTHRDRKSTRLNSSHLGISYAVFCLKKKTRELRTHGNN